ncbi:UNVERIFIED_CONTAM: hypothetical protein PYX00_010189 [Menopon gallinae]|uniref:Cyclic nucleotide-binding domain-containing protein n=1 Tax=Menopon gallinae TaxID=328185 RepID=A0AAW2HEZ6_9NEOP
MVMAGTECGGECQESSLPKVMMSSTSSGNVRDGVIYDGCLSADSPDRSLSLFRPSTRTENDVEEVANRLRRVESLSRLPFGLLQQLAVCGFYEDLEKGVTLFREGETGSCWYVLLSGTLAVRAQHQDGESKVSAPGRARIRLPLDRDIECN